MFLRRVLTILLGVFKVQCDISYILPNDSDIHANNKLSQCIVDIINKNKLSKATVLSNENERLNYALSSSVLNEIAEEIAKSGIPIVYLNETVDNIDTKYLYEENSITITNIEDCKSLNDVTDITLNENNKYLIIVYNFAITECSDIFKNITKKIADYHVDFLYEDKIKNAVKIFTYINILEAKTCDLRNDTKLVHLNFCENGHTKGKRVNVFPDKRPKNWMNCPINVGLGTLFPFTKSYNKSLRNYDIIKEAEGSDVEILKIVAQHLNASLKFYHINVKAENAMLKSSFLTFVLNSSLEVCAGGLYRIYDDVVSYSGIYSRQEIVWVYTTERNKASWTVFMKKTDEIYIFIIFYIFYSVIWNIFCYFDQDVSSLSNTFVYAWGTLFGGTSLHRARTLKQKILNFFYLLLCLHLYAYIGIELYPFLTIQGPPHEYENTVELSQSGKALYLIDDAKYFVDDEVYVTFANKSKSCIDFDDCIVKLLRYGGTTVLLDGLLPPIQVATAVSGEAKVLRAVEPILVVYHEMVIKKGSLLLGRLDKVVSRLFEAGICENLYEDAIGILVVNEARRASLNMLSDSYSCEGGCKISLSQSAGAFYGWILGCLMSCCAFCSEIIVNWRKNHVK